MKRTDERARYIASGFSASCNQIGQYGLHAAQVGKPSTYFCQFMLRNGGCLGAMGSVVKLQE